MMEPKNLLSKIIEALDAMVDHVKDDTTCLKMIRMISDRCSEQTCDILGNEKLFIQAGGFVITSDIYAVDMVDVYVCEDNIGKDRLLIVLHVDTTEGVAERDTENILKEVLDDLQSEVSLIVEDKDEEDDETNEPETNVGKKIVIADKERTPKSTRKKKRSSEGLRDLSDADLRTTGDR